MPKINSFSYIFTFYFYVSFFFFLKTHTNLNSNHSTTIMSNSEENPMGQVFHFFIVYLFDLQYEVNTYSSTSSILV